MTLRYYSASSMTWITLPLATVVAGVISFSSPCCVPLVPSYLSFLSGLPVSRLGTDAARSITLRAAVLFVAGFSLVFTVLGASSALVGALLLRNLPAITKIAGVGIIILGLAMAGLLRVPWLARERRAVLARQAFRASAGKGIRTVTAEDFDAKRNVPCSWEKNVVPSSDVAHISSIRLLLGDEAIQAIFVPSDSAADQAEQATRLFPEARIVGRPLKR